MGRRHTGQGEGGALGGEERDGVQEPSRLAGRNGFGELSRAPRRDWVYAFADQPSRRVGGERLGLSYSRERLEPVLRVGGIRRIADAGERAIAAAARKRRRAGDLEELRTLSEAVALVESSRAMCAPTSTA